MKKDNLVYVDDILSAIKKINRFCKDLLFEKTEDYITSKGVIKCQKQ